jgi:glycine betaine transporter
MNQLKSSNLVFNISCALAFLFLLWGALFPDHLAKITGGLQTSLLDTFGWLYVLAATSFLICAFCLIFSRWGDIPLGPDGTKPEFNLLTWFAMLFCAGMGIGLVFWGVAEPTSHFHDPSIGEGGTPQAARLALQYSFFHWGLHPWGIYTMVALALAYFQFRKGMPGLFSLGCQPVLGRHANGPLGTAVDVIAVFATVFGVATSLGFGAVQISGGLSYVFGISNSLTTQLILIAIVTVLFMLSAQTGLQRGIKYLSNLNMILALSLLGFLLFLGPTHFIMTIFPSTLGHYLQNLPTMWWIAWAPFVGTFIARISKGRTVRQFVLGVLLVPSLFCAFWFTVFGGTGIALELFQDVPLKAVMEKQGMEVLLFTVLEQYPMGTIMSLIAIFLIGTFFITSADSATFVLGTLTTNGSLNPPNHIKFTWGIIQSLSAAILLWSGGLKGLQTGAILAAFPFVFVIIILIISLLKSFKEEVKR